MASRHSNCHSRQRAAVAATEAAVLAHAFDWMEPRRKEDTTSQDASIVLRVPQSISHRWQHHTPHIQCSIARTHRLGVDTIDRNIGGAAGRRAGRSSRNRTNSRTPSAALTLIELTLALFPWLLHRGHIRPHRWDSVSRTRGRSEGTPSPHRRLHLAHIHEDMNRSQGQRNRLPR